MSNPVYVDISVFQPANINWEVYKAWSAAADGVSRVCIRSSYGVGYIDGNFEKYRAGALAAGIDQIGFYHYAYPQYNSAQAEANWQHGVVGSIREHDWIMLDYEESAVQVTAEWAYEWLSTQQTNYGKPPTIYAGLNMVQSRLQDQRLASFPLTLADWTYNPLDPPGPPTPWSKVAYWQYADNLTVPGIGTNIDADIFFGGTMPTKFELEAAAAMWTAIPNVDATVDTGIYNSWLTDYENSVFHGAPLTKELYGQFTWDGTPCSRQFFTGGWCEWCNGTPKWYNYA